MLSSEFGAQLGSLLLNLVMKFLAVANKERYTKNNPGTSVLWLIS